MKIIIAPDSFKGSCSSIQAAGAIEKGILEVFPEASVIKLPMADGGEGTVEALVAGLGGTLFRAPVTGPMGGTVEAAYGLLPDGTAVLEMSAASGLTLVPPHQRNPLTSTTYGTGELIREVLNKGCRSIIIGIGGSATNDGGAGMAQALGYSLTDSSGGELKPGGGQLGALQRIDSSNADKRLQNTEIKIACDVTNPLYGENGASAVYGPQKGATPAMVSLLDSNLRHFSTVIKRDLGRDVASIPGAGAAGGLGAGLMAFCGASLSSGIDTVLDALNFDGILEGADLVITGEGRADAQSAQGKVASGIGRRLLSRSAPPIPALLIAGSIGPGAEMVLEQGMTCLTSITDKPMSLEEAMRNVLTLLEKTSERAMRMLKAGMIIKSHLG
ncbi:MAG: glycerate kinase [Eubacteriales bacterium]|nr:glycerate kinase [Eubacteriales bacterium]